MTLLQEVCERLKAGGCHDVHVEHPGCVVVWAEDLIDYPIRSWWFGTANGTWQGDLMDDGQYAGQTLSTDLDGQCTDATAIATAILHVLNGESSVAMCPFCGSLHHTDVKDCPSIDPDQLQEELEARK